MWRHVLVGLCLAATAGSTTANTDLRSGAAAAKIDLDQSVQVAQINIQHFERRIFEGLILKRRSDLAIVGQVFGYDYTNHAWGYQRHGCLIGGRGQIYAYDSETSEAPALLNTMDPSDFSRARELGVSIIHSALEPALDLKHVTHDAGERVWSVLSDGKEIALKEIGDFSGDSLDTRFVELVSLISKWCPAAEGANILK
jgi:hypothetical protein